MNRQARIPGLCLAALLLTVSLAAPVRAVESIPWPGEETVREISVSLVDGQVSGADFYGDTLYVVSNGEGIVQAFTAEADGRLTVLPEYAAGKRILYPDGSGAPDAEGITLDAEGTIYVASERSGADAGTSRNSILQLDPDRDEAAMEWDLTELLPDCDANAGIEGLEWVSGQELAGKLYDKNTKAPFSMDAYPDCVGSGVFFTGLEKNGHVYGFILKSDGTAVKIANLKTGLESAVALDYDTLEHRLFALSDDNDENMGVIMTFDGSKDPMVTKVSPPAGLDTSLNCEGIAIGNRLTDAARTVYRTVDDNRGGRILAGTIFAPGSAAEPESTVMSAPARESASPEASPAPTGAAAPTAIPSPAAEPESTAPAAPVSGLLVGILAAVIILAAVWMIRRHKRRE